MLVFDLSAMNGGAALIYSRAARVMCMEMFAIVRHLTSDSQCLNLCAWWNVDVNLCDGQKCLASISLRLFVLTVAPKYESRARKGEIRQEIL